MTSSSIPSRLAIIAVIAMPLFVACSAADDDGALRGTPGVGNPSSPSTVPSTANEGGGPCVGSACTKTEAGAPPSLGPGGCMMGKSYVGFQGAELEADRAALVMGVDRRRIKPYPVLNQEYVRTTGNAPTLLSASASVFGQTLDRWYAEPVESAISVYTSYRVSFRACTAMTGAGADFATAPTAATSLTVCATFAHKFWGRAASPDEISACSEVAVADTSAETDPRKRWAYTCAAMLNSADFLTY